MTTNLISLKRPGYTRKYKVNSSAFLNEDNLSFYLLGAYMTDGCINGLKTQITSNDEEWLIDIRDKICPNKPVKNRLTSKAYDLYISDTDVTNWLISYGCVPHKSLTLSLKKDIPKEYIPDFIRGLIDGDGSVSFFDYNNHGYISKRISVYLCSASESIIDQVKLLIPKNITSYKNIREPTNSKIGDTIIYSSSSQYKLQFYNYEAQKFLQWIYYPNNPLSLKRKNDLAEKAIKYQFTRRQKLSLQEVEQIKQLYEVNKLSQKQLSVMFNINRSCISRLINSKTHKK